MFEKKTPLSIYCLFDWRTNNTLVGGCLLVWTGNVSAGYDQRRLEKDDIATVTHNTTTVDSILFDVQSQLNFIWFLQKGECTILLDISSGNTYKHLVEQSKGAVKEGEGQGRPAPFQFLVQRKTGAFLTKAQSRLAIVVADSVLGPLGLAWHT